MRCLICTTNDGKVREFKDKLTQFQFQTLKEEDIFLDIEETGSTFKENALIKLNTIIHTYPQLVDKFDLIIAEDSGLCVDSLNGAPGIYSARYSGVHGNDFLNNQRLLLDLKNSPNRKAHYEVCIAAHYNKANYTFNGEVHGLISDEQRGEDGFGYDPLFIPNGYHKTFGELNSDIKLKISHRTNAIELMMRAFHIL